MQVEFTQSEDSKILEPGFLAGLKRWALIIEFIHAVGLMRYYQKSFFKEKNDEKHKRHCLEKAREYEKLVDNIIERLWPAGPQTIKQQKLF